MPLKPGTRFGSYEVVEAAGAGGMGEVFRARDHRLHRDVALKVLPRDAMDSEDRRLRFEREAQVLASLSHMNIAQVFGITDADGVSAIAMEFVDGPTLADRLARGRLPLDEALPIARQIVDALDAAHESGIIHRDLKPANIKVTADGTVKVLDFGLAKAFDRGAGASSSAMVTTPTMTEAGIVLGTAAYMSPEQARGKAVDKRADIWAFGCVLYEMLAGRPPFPGETATDVIAAVVKNEPDWGALPPDTPSRLRRLLVRCLHKDPRGRLRDIGDARADLEVDDPRVNVVEAAPRSRDRWTVPVLAGALALMSSAFVWSTYSSGGATLAGITPTRLSVTFPPGAAMQLGQPQPSLALSPDGQKVAYTANGAEGPQLWIRDLGQFTATPLPGTGNGRNAIFSPDGKWIAFLAEGKLKKVPVTSGPPTILCDAVGAFGATWSAADEIVFFLGQSDNAGLWRVSVAGGEPQRVASGVFWYPDALPGGKTILATTLNPAAATSGDLTIVAVDVASGQVTRLFDGGTYARYAATGHLVYLRQGSLMATPFDVGRLKVTGEPTPVVGDVFMDPAYPSGNFALSASGALAYVPGNASDFRRALVTIGPDGSRPLIGERRYFWAPRVSPDGHRVAITLRGWHEDVWVVDTGRATFTRMTTTDWDAAQRPIWSRDGSRVAFEVIEKTVPNIFWAPADGNGPEERLTTSAFSQIANAFSPDGQSLVFTEYRPDTGADLFFLSLTPDRSIRPLLQTRFNESTAALSPDGKWIAYQSNRSGADEVYVAPFPAMQPATLISTAGGNNPRWPNGSRLYFRQRDSVMRVDLELNGSIRVSPPQPVAGGVGGPSGLFDVMPDGRILIVEGEDLSARGELRIVLNWHEELKRLAPR